jgi:Glycosyl hydrolases family 2, sugar binding domain/Glycosyl hydrolases family 2, TIM barrel domain/Glycosyl hydrolases family 2
VSTEPTSTATSLDGAWSFWPDLERRLPTGPGAPFATIGERVSALGDQRTAVVPSPWQAQFDDLRLWAGTAWYERAFDAPPATGRVLLRFGAVDYFATVWVNGRLGGEHEGGYLPFALDVTELVDVGGTNTITVRVLDVGPGDEDGPFPFSEIPHGKQSWYGAIGGLWQSVWLETRGRVFADRVRAVRADPATGDLTAHIDLDRPAGTDVEIRWRIFAPDGGVVAGDDADPDDPVIRCVVQEPLAWDLDAPNLYRIEVDVVEDGAVTDRRVDAFGFRSVAVHGGRVVLNGRPVYLLGALDQDYWMPGIATPSGDEAIEAQARLARDLGLNLLRCHIKVPDPRYLDIADRTGLLVWCEPPNWIRLTPAARGRVRDTITGMVERDANHPSLVIRSVVNEDWGTDLTTDAGHRAWLRETTDWLRSLDPTRLVVDNSACPPNFHVTSDLNDYHLYRSVPEQSASWRRWTADWVRDPNATYTPHGDGERTGKEPLVLSEFGIWGLPDVRALADRAGEEPWWFETGADHSERIVQPVGVRDRFDAWGLADVFGSFDGFVRASQEHEFEGLKLQIEDLRSHDEVAGYVITELTDVHWEANGLLDMRRRPKAFHDRFATINAPRVVVVRPEQTRYRSGDRIIAEVRTADESGATESRVVWEMDGSGIGGEVASGDRIAFDAPTIDRPTATLIVARWVNGSGAIVNHARAPLWLFPADDVATEPHVAVGARWEDVAGTLASGGRAVLVADDVSAIPDDAPIGLEPFAAEDDGSGSTIYGNGWVLSTGMGWISPTVGDAVGVGPRVDLAFEGMTPGFVLTGYEPDMRRDVLAGHYLGWLHRMRATIAAFAHGEGAGIVCTFPLLRTEHRQDPLASSLLARLTALAASPNLTPRMRW